MRDDAYPYLPTRDLADPELWLRSADASRSRRARAARQSQISVRTKRTGFATLAALALGSTSAFAASGGASADSGSASAPATSATSAVKSATSSLTTGGSAQTRAVQKALGLPQTGRTSTKLKQAVRAFQRAHGLTVDGVVGPQTLAALGVTSAAAPAAAPAAAATPAASGVTAKLAAIAQCESGGNPAAVSPDGLYYGKYQFDVSTWKANGGSGQNAAAASESEQDQIATKLYQSQGATPWPVCGKQAA